MYNLFLQLYNTVGKVSTDIAHRAVRLRQQSFLYDVHGLRLGQGELW